MNYNNETINLSRFNFHYNLKTKSFDIPKRIRFPDIPLPSDALKGLNTEPIHPLDTESIH